MDAIIAVIGRLVANGSAYAAEGHVLFNTTRLIAGYAASFPDAPLDEMIAGARVEVAPTSSNPGRLRACGSHRSPA